MADSLIKGYIGKEDFTYNSTESYPTSTWARTSSVGGTENITYFPDVYKTHISVVNAQYYNSGALTHTTITTALAGIGTTNKRILYIGPGAWTIGANVDWSAYTNVTFWFDPGALFSHGAFTIDMSGSPIMASSVQIFNGTGTVSLSDEQPIQIKWFGSTVAAIQAAHDALSNRGGTLIADSSSIDFGTTTVTITKHNCNIIGKGPARENENDGTMWYTDEAHTDYLIQWGDDSTTANYGIIQNISFHGHTSRTYEANGVNLYKCNHIKIRDCRFELMKGTAIQARRSWDCKIEDVEVFTSGDTSDPAVWLNSIDASDRNSVMHCDRLRIENGYGELFNIDANSTHVKCTSCKFEGNGNASGKSLVTVAGDGNTFAACQFHTPETGAYVVTLSGNYNNFGSCHMAGSARTESGGFNITGEGNRLDFVIEETSNKLDGTLFNVAGASAISNVIGATCGSAKVGTPVAMDASSAHNYARIDLDTDPGTESTIAGTGNVLEGNYSAEESHTAASGNLRHWGVTKLDTSGLGAGQAGTLPDGTKVGQIKTIVMTDATQNSIIIVTNHRDSSNDVGTFSVAGQMWMLTWDGTKWVNVASYGVSLA